MSGPEVELFPPGSCVPVLAIRHPLPFGQSGRLALITKPMTNTGRSETNLLASASRHFKEGTAPKSPSPATAVDDRQCQDQRCWGPP